MNLLNFYSKIELSPGGCMLWGGSVDRYGYGRYGLGIKNELNTYLNPSGQRICRPCNRIAVDAYRKRKASN